MHKFAKLFSERVYESWHTFNELLKENKLSLFYAFLATVNNFAYVSL